MATPTADRSAVTRLPVTRLPVGLSSRAPVTVQGDDLAAHLLAAVLAAGGRSVRLVRSGRPRVASYNSVPYTAELLWLIGSRFGVPDIGDLATADTLPPALRATALTKRHLGFVQHSARARADQRTLQFCVPSEHAEWQLDAELACAWSADLAARCGAAAEPTETTETIETSEPRRWSALFTGLDEPAASDGTRDAADTLPWHSGTTAHLTEDGVVQVVALDADRYAVEFWTGGRTQAGPEAAFGDVLARYPHLRQVFDRAVQTSAWRAEGGSVASVTPDAAEGGGSPARVNVVLAGEACGLFGQDLTTALEQAHGVAALLLDESLDDEQAVRRADTFVRDIAAHNARWTATARAALYEPAVAEGWLRSWLLWSITSALALKAARLEGARSGAWSAVSRFGLGYRFYAPPTGIPELLSRITVGVARAHAESWPSERAEQAIYAALRSRRYVPPFFAFADVSERRYRLSRRTRIAVLLWVLLLAPRDYRRMLTADNVTASADHRPRIAA